MNNAQTISQTNKQPMQRSKALTQAELEKLKNNIFRLPLSSGEVLYSLVSKDSNSGLFSNDRLLVLNTQDQEVSYLSKVPQGLIPLLNQQQFRSLKVKSTISRQGIKSNNVVDFKVSKLVGRPSTLQISCLINKQQVKWAFQTGNSKITHEWIQAIKQHMLKDLLPPIQDQIIQQMKPYNKENQANLLLRDPSNSKISENKSKLPESNVVPVRTRVISAQSRAVDLGHQKIYHDQEEQRGSRIANLDISSQLKYLKNNSSKQLIASKQPQKSENSYKPYTNYEQPNILSKNDSRDRNLMQDQQKPLPFSRLNSKDNIKESINRLKSASRRIQPLPEQQQQQFYRQNPSVQQPAIRINPVQSKGRLGTSLSQSNTYLNPYSSGKSLPKNQSRAKPLVIQDQNQYGVSRTQEIQRAPAFKQQSSSRFNSKKSLQRGRSGGFNHKRWNQIFAETGSKLQVYQDFISTSYNVVREIINELPLDINQRQYLPIESKQPFYTYYDQGIIVVLHMFSGSSQSAPTNNFSSNAPLLYDMGSYQMLKRQFYNYNLMLAVTGNQGFIKVPLCAYFQYKGLLALCKAQIPQNFTSATPKRFQKQFDIIEDQIHSRFMYGTFDAYLHPGNKYIIVENLRQLIPKLPMQLKLDQFFRKQFLLEHSNTIDDLQSCNHAHQIILNQFVPQLLQKLQTLQTYAVCSSDLSKVFHEAGVSMAYLPVLTQQSTSPFLRRLFNSELVSTIVVGIFRSQLSRLLVSFPRDQMEGASKEDMNEVVIDSCHALLELVFGYSNAAQDIWRVVVEQCSQRYKISISKQDIIPGYLLSALIQKLDLRCDFRRSSFNKHNVRFFVSSENIPKDLLLGFNIKIRRYDLSPISPLVRDVQNILYGQPTGENFRALVQMLDLRKQSIPGCLEPLQPVILSFLSNFVAYGEHQQFQHVGIYNMVVLQPHTFYSVKQSLLAVKWCIKKKLLDQALRIYEMKEIENAFWLGQYNPAITQFYDFFCMYDASIGHFDRAQELARLSIKNTSKVVGAQQLPVADKYYQLGNIYFKMGKKEEALRQYQKTKEILRAHQQTKISQYAVILLKISLLFLNFGKIGECVHNSLQALQIFQEIEGNQQDQIGTFEILSRCYQITKKHDDHLKLAELVADKFNSTQSSSIFTRMTKIVLFINLKQLSSAQSKAFLGIVDTLQDLSSDLDETQIFTYLHRKSQEEVLLHRVVSYLQNVIALNEQIKRKDLFRRFKSLSQNTRHQAEEMLVVIQALGQLVGFSYLSGCLRQQQA